jgi:hypothetical protein
VKVTGVVPHLPTPPGIGVGKEGIEGSWVMVSTLFSSLPLTLLVEGGIFLTLAVGFRVGRKLLKQQR